MSESSLSAETSVAAATDPSVIEICSGLTKRILQAPPDDAPAPSSGEKVSVHYVGTLASDGSQFDSSFSRNKPFEFTLGCGQVIKGWDLGVATMKRGEKSLFTIASDLAYGAAGSPPTIPGGATLNFEVTLLSPIVRVSDMTTAARVAAAEAAKASGNKAVSMGMLQDALASYAEVLRMLEGLHDGGESEGEAAASPAAVGALTAAAHSNSAMVLLKQARYAEAAGHASKALAAEPTNVKALFRRGTALGHSGDLAGAKADLARAAKLAPEDAGIRAELARVLKLQADAAAKLKAAYGGFLAKTSLYAEKPAAARPPHEHKGPLPHAFFDVSIGGAPAARIVFRIYEHAVPRTAANFLALCAGGGANDSTGKPLHYKSSIFHRVIKGFMLQGGDYQLANGTGGESIHGPKFADEAAGLKHHHDRPYLLSMANAGPNTNGSQFFITTAAASHLDGKHVVFGEVVAGFAAVRAIEDVPKLAGTDTPSVRVEIVDCGTLTPQEGAAAAAQAALTAPAEPPAPAPVDINAPLE